jgi:hypothetical protein
VTANPVMQALMNAKMQEASAFGKWCILKGVRCMPAAPAHVAAFVRDCEPLIPLPKIWEAVREISESHLLNGFADPAAGGVVAETINGIAKIAPPRSWPKEQKARFGELPFDLQQFIAGQEKRQDAVVKIAMQEAADARKAAGLDKRPKHFYRDRLKDDNGTPTQTSA